MITLLEKGENAQVSFSTFSDKVFFFMEDTSKFHWSSAKLMLSYFVDLFVNEMGIFLL